MYHPETMYEMAKMRMAEAQQDADRQRLVRQAGSVRRSGAIDSVRFRDRITRLFGTIWPASPTGTASASA
jgi:hypothetical protein